MCVRTQCISCLSKLCAILLIPLEIPVGCYIGSAATWHKAMVSLKMKHTEESFSRYERYGLCRKFCLRDFQGAIRGALFAMETQHTIHRDKLSRPTIPLDAMLTQLSSFWLPCNGLLKWDVHWKRLIRPCVLSHERIRYREYRRYSQSGITAQGILKVCISIFTG